MKTRRPGWRFLLIWLIAGALAWALLIYPLYVIRPFRHQGARELMAALAVMRYRPAGVAFAAVAMLAAFAWYWRLECRQWRRFFAALCVVNVCAAAALSRINVYELMFHPAGTPVIADAASCKLDGSEMVIAVKVNGAARAYPIRSMSYHHIFNDMLAGEPVAATY